MAVSASLHTLSTTASVIAQGSTTPQRGHKQVIVTNASATIYIGGSNVTSAGANGVSVATTATYTIQLGRYGCRWLAA